jgi:hypothetical protein
MIVAVVEVVAPVFGIHTDRHVKHGKKPYPTILIDKNSSYSMNS